MTTTFTTLVVGATGATGRHVVRQLLARQCGRVICIVRSRSALLRILLDDDDDDDKKKNDTTRTTTTPDPDRQWPLLTIIEGSVLDLSDERLWTLIVDVDVIVSCLGHNGIFSRPRRLVTDTLARLVDAAVACHQENENQSSSMKTKKKYIKLILMSSDGVFAHHVDDPRTSLVERIIFWLLRYILPPHADNEDAAAYLQQHLPPPSSSQQSQSQPNNNNIQWVIVRPTDLVNEPSVTEYVLFDQPPPGGVLFGQSHAVSRINVANFMVRLVTDEPLFAQYQFTFPVIHNVPAVAPSPNDRSKNDKKKTV